MYEYYNPNPLDKRTGDCVVRALSKALNKTWNEVYIILCLEGYLYKDWGNTNSVWGNYLKSIGYQSSVIPNICPSCYTINDFADDHPAGTFIVATGSHVVCVQDGDIYDSWDSSNEIPTSFFYKED